MDTFERRWRLLEALLDGPKLRREIWEDLINHHGVEGEAGLRSESCLSDDVRVLRSIGIGFRPLTLEDKKTKQAYELDPSYLPLLGTREETIALLAAVQILEAVGLPEAKTIESLINRIPLSIRKGIVDPKLEELLSSVHSPYDPEVIRCLQEGIRKSRAMRISYRAVGKEPRFYYIDKASITLQEGQLYLLAHCPKESGKTKYLQNREFRLDRFVRIGDHPIVEVLGTMTKETVFPTFKMQLWISPYLAPYFSCNNSHKVIVQEDGSKLVYSQEAIALRAIRRVLSYGEQARVLGPDFLIVELQKTIDRMGQNHSP